MKLNSSATILEEVLPSDVINGTVTVPDSVTSIDAWAFHGCTGLKTITLPAGLTSIDRWAFDGCTGLTSITLPAGLTRLGNWAFYGCDKLKTIIIDSPTKEEGKKVIELLPKDLQERAVIQNVAMEKALCEIIPLIQGVINSSLPLQKDTVGEIFQSLLPANQVEKGKTVFNHLYENYDRLYKKITPQKIAKNNFITRHKELLKEAQSGFFGFFRRTELLPEWSLKQIIEHGMKRNNTTRQVCVEMNWLTSDGSLSEKAPGFIKELVKPYSPQQNKN